VQPDLDSGLLVSKRFCSTAANFSSVEHAVNYGDFGLTGICAVNVTRYVEIRGACGVDCSFGSWSQLHINLHI
jgi:hypothetical protein